MKRSNLIGPGLAAAFLVAGLVACADFDKGDVVEGKVGRVQGDPCLISLQLNANGTRYGRGLVARLQTPECRVAAGPVVPQSR